MPIFACEFGDAESYIPTRIECVGADTQEKVNRMRLFLMHQAITSQFQVKEAGQELPLDAFGETPEEVVDGVASLNSTLDVLQTADPQDLPTDIVMELVYGALSIDDESVVITDRETSVALYPYGDSLNELEISGCKIDSDSVSALEDIADDNEFIIQAIRHGCNYYGYTMEPRAAEDRDFTEHYALGHMDETGQFKPVITVLDKSHPVRAAQHEGA